MKRLLTLLFVLFIMFPALAQREVDGSSFMDRVYFGGGLDLAFGTITIIGASPLVGYMITEKLSAGVGITYQYYKDNRFTPDFTTSIYGGRLFARYNIFDPFFLYNEYEITSFDFTPSMEGGRESISAYYLGAGLHQPIGRNAGFMVIALYDLLYDEFRSSRNSAFSFRLGFSIGF